MAAGEGRKAAGQHGALDHGGVLHLAGPQTLGLLHLGQARIFDSHGRHAGHDGEQAQILAGELLDDARGIQVEQADDTVLGLQRHGHHTPDLALDDAGVEGEGRIGQGVAHQHGALFAHYQIAHVRADAEPLAFGGAHA